MVKIEDSESVVHTSSFTEVVIVIQSHTKNGMTVIIIIILLSNRCRVYDSALCARVLNSDTAPGNGNGQCHAYMTNLMTALTMPFHVYSCHFCYRMMLMLSF